MTVLELLTASMHRLGYLEAAEVPSAADAQACLTAANLWIDALGLEDTLVYCVRRHVFNLQANVGSYTIGPGGTFNVPRPVWVDRCGVIPDPAATTPREVPLGHPLTPQEYAHVVAKTATAPWPGAVYYDPYITAGLGTIHVLSVPDSSTPDLVLYLPERLSEFGDVADDIALPTGHGRFFVTNLAVEFAPILGETVSSELAHAAGESKALVQRANIRPEELLITHDTPGMGRRGHFDINHG